jgi:glycerophosphoryl diester phosphodiesterase
MQTTVIQSMPKVIAHRGFSARYPENTMAAFRAAWEAGADGLELDVQRTKDGHLVILHDEKVDRTTNGTGWVKDFTLEELLKLDAGTWKDVSFKGERIPTLEQLLEEVAHIVSPRPLLLNIELKTAQVPYPGLEEQVIAAIRKFGLTDRVLISSFNHYSLRTVTRLAPEIPIGLLYMEGLVEPWHYAKRMKALALHPYYPNIIPELVEGCRKEGVRLHPYTVDREMDMRRIVKAGVDAIITNHPDRLRRVIDSARRFRTRPHASVPTSLP